MSFIRVHHSIPKTGNFENGDNSFSIESVYALFKNAQYSQVWRWKLHCPPKLISANSLNHFRAEGSEATRIRCDRNSITFDVETWTITRPLFLMCTTSHVSIGLLHVRCWRSAAIWDLYFIITFWSRSIPNQMPKSMILRHKFHSFLPEDVQRSLRELYLCVMCMAGQTTSRKWKKKKWEENGAVLSAKHKI